MLTPIRSYTTPEEAYIVRGLLEEHGIPATVEDAGYNSVFPSLDDSHGSTMLLVDDDHLSAAEELLKEHKD